MARSGRRRLRLEQHGLRWRGVHHAASAGWIWPHRLLTVAGNGGAFGDRSGWLLRDQPWRACANAPLLPSLAVFGAAAIASIAGFAFAPISAVMLVHLVDDP